MDAEALGSNPIFHQDWYHSIELLPGMFTKGRDFPNVELTRSLLKTGGNSRETLSRHWHSRRAIYSFAHPPWCPGLSSDTIGRL